MDVPRKRDLDFEIMIKAAALDLKLQPENGFILKVHYICNVHLEWLIGEQKVKEREREREFLHRFASGGTIGGAVSRSTLGLYRRPRRDW